MSQDYNYGTKQQDSLGYMDTYADIVYCIDLTSSMSPILRKVTETASQLHFDLQRTMHENHMRSVKQLRIRVIGFRDAYCDGKMSFEQSRFFNLPDEAREYEDFLKTLKAKGGGDAPENALEAIALAMQSDWCRPADRTIRKRHIIILFTDAPAHPLEMSMDGVDVNYPPNMPQTYSQLVEWWEGQDSLNDPYSVTMDKAARRFGIFAPTDEYPWSDFETDFSGCLISHISADKGGEDISTQRLIKMLSETIQ